MRPTGLLGAGGRTLVCWARAGGRWSAGRGRADAGLLGEGGLTQARALLFKPGHCPRLLLPPRASLSRND
ncbi:hypothetical protein ACIA8G_37885 [Lentzea sp. NPDC051213]|uniref:hypothetical protein n=1 Tax=Lentzea sp. NPDC051213 TaxID=3364126 RepID=UPI003794D6C9